MSRYLAFTIWLGLVIGMGCLAQAQQILAPIVNFGPPKVASYTGPGDIVTGATAFWSCGRAYKASYANGTNSLCDLVASSGGASVGTLRVKTNGYVDLSAYFTGSVTPASACAAATGGSCAVSKMYDQTGNGEHAVQATSANQPILTFSSLNGLPCLTYNGSSNMVLATAGTITAAQPFSFTGVAQRSASVGTIQRVMSANGTVNFGYRPALNTFGITAGTTLQATASDSAFHAFSGVFNSTSSAVVVDGTATTGNAGANPILPVVGSAMNDPSGSSPLQGYFCEGGFAWPIAFNSTQYANLNSNMHSATVGWNF